MTVEEIREAVRGPASGAPPALDAGSWLRDMQVRDGQFRCDAPDDVSVSCDEGQTSGGNRPDMGIEVWPISLRGVGNVNTIRGYTVKVSSPHLLMSAWVWGPTSIVYNRCGLGGDRTGVQRFAVRLTPRVGFDCGDIHAC